VAAPLPLLIAGLAIVGTFLLLRLANEFVSVLDFRPQPDHRAWLGLAIDYSPLVVPRTGRRSPNSARGRGDEADAQHRRPHGPVLLDHGCRRAGLRLMVFPQRFLY